jgi:hypothetical protein
MPNNGNIKNVLNIDSIKDTINNVDIANNIRNPFGKGIILNNLPVFFSRSSLFV